MELFFTLTISMSISSYDVLQDITVGGNWVKDAWDLFVLFLTCEHSLISKILNKNVEATLELVHWQKVEEF